MADQQKILFQISFQTILSINWILSQGKYDYNDRIFEICLHFSGGLVRVSFDIQVCGAMDYAAVYEKTTG